MTVYQNLHKDVLFAMVTGLTQQFRQGSIPQAEYDAQVAPIMNEIYDRQAAQLAQLEVDLKRLRDEQRESLESNKTEIGIYDAFLEQKGLAEEFEEFESRWWEAWGKEHRADG